MRPQARSIDTISTLVNIYGSQEAFISAWKTMLQERLLKGLQNDYAKEVTNIEMLKSRFGEAAMTSFAIMLRDCKDSDRIHSEKAPGGNSDFMGYDSLYVKVVSRGDYWNGFAHQPNDDDRKLRLDQESFRPNKLVEKHLMKYQRHFARQKTCRSLAFRQGLGQVTLTLDFRNGSKQFKVSPLDASLIMLFASPTDNTVVTRTLSQLASSLKFPSADPLLDAEQE